jgi:diaminohydroxyphosphoribosylaminopyrimidine deaminase/5-amino-6-(5-phosphoribosylamino)uracil reductase
MARALQLAHRGYATTDPNPRVGCDVVNQGRIVGEGWHVRAGEPHAEVHALREAGDAARGATAYVTLEPCCHQGRTPACSNALLEAGISRVVVAMEDPNPLVSGKGLQQLRDAGVEVRSGVCQQQAEALNPGFIMRMREGRPYVRVKLAMSLDGRTAMASGESRWITSAAARRDVHRLRARSSAILTGIGTVLADDPALTVRLADTDEMMFNPPLRVILDPGLVIEKQAQVLQPTASTLVITATGQTRQRQDLAGVEIVEVPARDDRLDLSAVMQLLAERHISELLVESGATLCGAMLEAGLVDEIVVYMAPLLMGDQAKGLFHLPALQSMAQRIELAISDIRPVGDDWRITATVKR